MACLNNLRNRLSFLLCRNRLEVFQSNPFGDFSEIGDSNFFPHAFGNDGQLFLSDGDEFEDKKDFFFSELNFLFFTHRELPDLFQNLAI